MSRANIKPNPYFALALIAFFASTRPASLRSQEPAPPPTSIAADTGSDQRPTLDTAKDRLRCISKIYLATLEVMHDRYFHGERAMVPARAMEDVFAQADDELNIRAHWIAVNTKAMSLNHEPKTDFEKSAAAAIAEGKPELESISDGKYHLALPVPLTNKCVNCHAGMFRDPPKKKSFAGLILSTPIKAE